MPLAMGQLLRLRGMIESTATSVEPDGNGAAALTQGYLRLRGMTRALVEESSATLDEFDTAFPDIEAIEIEAHESPRDMGMRPMRYAPHAKQARALLGELSGWVSGLIAEIEYEQQQRRD
jgi:hypothetical protein